MNIFRNTGCSSGFWPDGCSTPCQECGVPCQNCSNSCCNMGGCPCTPTCPDSIRIGTTITGAPGTEAQVTNSGTAQNPVLNFVIPQGVAGPQGPQGLQGPQGPQGFQGVQGEMGLPGPTGPVGPAGPQGAVGPTGPTGPIGPAGAGLETVTPYTPGVSYPQGAMLFYNGSLYQAAVENPSGTPGSSADYNLISVTGPQGPAGAPGAEGPIGPTGPQGPAGAPGAEGPIGPTGPQGPAGAPGAEGPIGPTGPQGPVGAMPPVSALYATNTAAQTTPNRGSSISFDTNQATTGADITHAPGSADFVLTETGLYRINYSAVLTNATAPGTVGLELQQGGAPVPGSIRETKINNTADPATISSDVLVNITNAPETVTLNSTQDNTTAAYTNMVIQKLN